MFPCKISWAIHKNFFMVLYWFTSYDSHASTTFVYMIWKSSEVFFVFKCIKKICYTHWCNLVKFDVHVIVHRDKFLIIKPTRCNNFSNLFLEWNSTCFGQFLCPSSRVFTVHSNSAGHIGSLTAASSYQQTCMIYTIAVCTVKNSWWWTEELSETCRVSFQE